MHPSHRPVAACPTRHLVELDIVEGQVVEHDVADIGDVNALAKGARRDDHAHVAGPEGVLNRMADRAGEPPVVERRVPREFGYAFAQKARKPHGSIPRVDVDHRLAARCGQPQDLFVLVGAGASVLDSKVVAHGGVEHDGVDPERLSDRGGHIVRGGRGDGQHSGSAKYLERFSQSRVRRPVTGPRAPDVVRLVDDHEAHAAALGESCRMEVKELGRGQNDVERAVGERLEGGVPVTL